jgi:cytoskeletal protein CcmA (bactofilin family)
MPRKSHEDALGVAGAETIIGTGVTLKGTLKSQSDIMIDGHLAGDIQAEGDVTVGVNAVIDANITAANVTIAGRLNGHIAASGSASILQTGNVKGDITATGLAISAGAVFIGRSNMSSPPELTPPEEP